MNQLTEAVQVHGPVGAPDSTDDQLSGDAVLVSAALAGDECSFRVLVERHQKRIFRFLLRHAISSAEAEELTQEVFLQAYISLRTFNRQSRLTTWLTGIALNLVRNWINRSGGMRRCVEHTDPEAAQLQIQGVEDCAVQRDPESAVAYIDAIRALMEQFERLPPPSRECLILIVMEELPYEEVAQILNEPIGSVKSRVSRARRLLKERLPRGHLDALAGN